MSNDYDFITTADVAWGRVDASDGDWESAGSHEGFVDDFVHSGAGVFVLELPEGRGVAQDRFSCTVTPTAEQATVGFTATAAWINANHVRVTTSNGTALADIDFEITVRKLIKNS